MKKIIWILTIMVFIFNYNIKAQPGTNDTTFNYNDIGFGYGDGAVTGVFATSIQSNGKIIIGGNFTSYNGTNTQHISRINNDYSLDVSFNIGSGANDNVNTIAIQSNDKILIGGDFVLYDGTFTSHLARLNSDGSIDVSFNIGSGANGNVFEIYIQSDGKILIGGSFTSYNGTTCNRIARLNTNGSLDTTFNIGSGFDNDVKTISVQNDGKVVIGGSFSFYNGIATNRIARLNINGSFDNTFNVGTGATGSIYTICLQSDEKIIIGGSFTNFNNISMCRLARLNTNGSLDATFNIGTGANNSIATISTQDDNKIIIGGNFISYNGIQKNHIVRVNPDGSIDTSFNIGLGANNDVLKIIFQNNSKILIAGNFSAINGIAVYSIAQINNNGSIDSLFNIGTSANNYISGIALQSDGKILIGGNFTSYFGTIRKHLARINSDGSLDSTFNIGSGTDGFINTIIVQNDGKIIIGGAFIYYNGITSNYIARLNINGSIDTSFNIGLGANGYVNAIYLQSDGKIIIGGNFTSYNGISINRIARLNQNGKIDTTFHIGTGVNQKISTISGQNDGKIIIGGDFTTLNGISINRIARLNSDGTLDYTFNSGSGANNSVFTTAIQDDGKILIGGYFNYFNGNNIKYLIRLKSDGSIDSSFYNGISSTGCIYTICLENNEKIIIGGTFSSYNGLSRNQIARLNTNGAVDTTFNIGTGANYFVYSSVVQDDGKIIIGGSFTAYNGIGRNRIVRIIGGDILTLIPRTTTTDILLYPNPANKFITVETTKLSTIEIISITGQSVKTINNINNKKTIDISELSSGVYSIKIKADDEIIVKKIIKQ